MSATLKYLNPSTRYAEFFIDSDGDLTVLPTILDEGQDNLSTVHGVSQGSKAVLTNSDMTYYRLSGNNVWVKITRSSGGGGSGSDTSSGNAIVFDDNGNIISMPDGMGVATDDDVNNMFP